MIEFTCVNILVFSHSLLKPIDYFQSRLDPNVRRNQDFFQFVEYFIVNGRLAYQHSTQSFQKAFFCFVESLVQIFFFRLAENTKQTHAN